jgi:hypothetical protein
VTAGGATPTLADADRARVAATLARLIARAEQEVPEAGPFDPVVERCPLTHPRHAGVHEVVLRIGAGQGDGAGRRFFDVRVRTAEAGSESSTWLHFAEQAVLLSLLRDPLSGLAATLAAIEGGAESLARHDLR